MQSSYTWSANFSWTLHIDEAINDTYKAVTVCDKENRKG